MGDRWLAGETVEGVRFAQHQRVTVADGAHAGEGGTVLLLLGVGDDPSYLVSLERGGETRVRQSGLRSGGD